jgi:hypothetical protein
VTRDTTAGATTTPPVADTDYYLINNAGDYAVGPYRALVLHGAGSVTRFGTGRKVVELEVVAGHQDVTVPLTTLGTACDADVTDIVPDDLDRVSPGMTLLIDTEQLYVRALVYTDDVATSATVVRGVNGTTAASHIEDADISVYVYDPRVVSGTLEVWGKRWAARQANADGTDGGLRRGLEAAHQERAGDPLRPHERPPDGRSGDLLMASRKRLRRGHARPVRAVLHAGSR